MIQDIGDHVFVNTYNDFRPAKDDFLIVFDGSDALVADGRTPIPRVDEATLVLMANRDDYVYAFSIDGARYFIAPYLEIASPVDEKRLKQAKLRFTSIHDLIDNVENIWRFAYMTGLHLTRWYAGNRFCGRCGHRLMSDRDERALFCPSCGNHVFPRINPAIIVAVTDGDRILMTRYANRPYVQRALIAGFCEIGETAEDTVRREVHEETGVHVKNIEYISNQPWGMSGDLLLGYKAELDGDDEITIDPKELKCAEWVHRDDIYEDDDDLSLTRKLVMMFKHGEL